MGNVTSILEDGGGLEHSCDWDFVGRQQEIKELNDLISNKQVVEIHGLMQIGKSRLLKTLIKEVFKNIKSEGSPALLFYFDFQTCHAGEHLIRCVQTAFDTLSPTKKHTIETVDQPSELAKSFIDLANTFRKGSQIFIFLDNLHVINSKALKEKLQSFIKDVTKESTFKFVLTTNDKLMSTSKSFKSYELRGLEENATLELVHVVTENHYRRNEDEHVFMTTIARLCEGLPLAAMLAGTELKENEYFLEPREMVEILLINRLKALSPDVYPEEERISTHRQAIDKSEQLAPYFAAFVKRLSEETSGTTLDTNDALQALGDNKATKAKAKKNLICLNQNGVVSNLHDNTFQFHGVIRECAQMQKLLSTVEALPEEERQECEYIIHKNMRENLCRAHLEVSDEVVKNPKKLEEYLLSLSIKSEESCEERADTGNQTDATTDESFEPHSISQSSPSVSSEKVTSSSSEQSYLSDLSSESIGDGGCISLQQLNERFNEVNVSNKGQRQIPGFDCDKNIPYSVQESGGDSLAGPHALPYIQ